MSLKQNVFWGKNVLFRGAAVSAYRQAMANQTKSRDAIDRLNWEKRKKLVAYAYANSEFYRQLYDQSGFAPDELVDPEEWSKVPVLEKHHLRQFESDILVKGLTKHRLIRTTTGGSTGTPVLTYRDRGFPEETIKWRMLARWGASPADDILMLWRIPLHSKGIGNALFNTVLWWPTRRYKFDVSNISTQKLDSIERVLLRKKPKIIWGYVGALEEVALHLQRRGIHLDYSPLVWATASPISSIQMTLFKNVFGSRILDQYASSEVHWIASNTPGTRNLLVDYDFRHVEVVDPGNNQPLRDRDGDLLITDLENKVFPLIRYRNGDRAALLTESPSKPYPFPTMSPVRGRTSDTLKSPSGARIPGEYLTTIFDDCVEFIQQFTVLQKKDYSVTISVCLTPAGSAVQGHIKEILKEKENELRSKLSNEVDVSADLVDAIPHERGKTRFVRSELIT